MQTLGREIESRAPRSDEHDKRYEGHDHANSSQHIVEHHGSITPSQGPAAMRKDEDVRVNKDASQRSEVQESGQADGAAREVAEMKRHAHAGEVQAERLAENTSSGPETDWCR